jgi:hypothetical protein
VGSLYFLVQHFFGYLQHDMVFGFDFRRIDFVVMDLSFPWGEERGRPGIERVCLNLIGLGHGVHLAVYVFLFGGVTVNQCNKN